MAQRGVPRPMARGHGDHGAPYSDQRHAMLREHHEGTLWVPWTLVMLGVWMALAPVHLGHGNEAQWVEPSGGRGVWFGELTHTRLRADLMIWSDVASGVLLTVLGLRALTPGRPVTRWLACGIGVWLSAAPLLFWAPTAAAYVNDTLVGMLVIALTILIPGMPHMILFMKMGAPIPPGWTYGPSSWPQRFAMIVTGFLGLLVSRHLAMFQLGYIDRIHDPFFGDSTAQVLNSSLSHSLPISDAGLGAFAYTFEFLMGFMGSPTRWRTMPWMVTFFGILVIPLGLVHILLVMSQPVVVGAWCTYCLVAAALMLPMIPLEVDEVVAMAQHLRRSVRRGTSLWSVFWKGGAAEDDAWHDEAAPRLAELPDRPRAVLGEAIRGMSFPWTLVALTAVGIAITALPGATGMTAANATSHQVCGAVIVVVAVVAMGEVVRAVRLLAIPAGITLVALAWVVGAGSIGIAILSTSAGAAAAALALPRGRIVERYGDWDSLVV